MDSLVLVVVGYVAWCAVAFLIAKMMKVENSDHKAISLVYVLLAAPMVLLDIITGKGTFR